MKRLKATTQRAPISIDSGFVAIGCSATQAPKVVLPPWSAVKPVNISNKKNGAYLDTVIANEKRMTAKLIVEQ